MIFCVSGVDVLPKTHEDVIKMETFPRYWTFVRIIHWSPVNSPHKWPVTLSFDIFFDLRLNKRLSKQSWGWWFETLSRPLWCHHNDTTKVPPLHIREMGGPSDIASLAINGKNAETLLKRKCYLTKLINHINYSQKSFLLLLQTIVL